MRRLVGVALAAVAAGCANEPADTEGSCATAQIAALYGGAREPPWPVAHAQQMAIGVLESPTGLALCTATEIAPGWALTAGHCARSDRLWFRSPSSDLGPTAACSVASHPQHDALLLKLQGEPELSSCASPIELVREPLSEELLGGEALIAGTGLTEDESSGELLFLETRVTALNATEIRVDGHGESGACTGDSGGPLLLRDSSGKVRVAGVLDRGSADCLGIDVYVRADVLEPWVRDTMAASTSTRCRSP